MGDRDVVIIGAVRTPFGKFGGEMREIPSIRLGAHVIRAVLQRAGVEPATVEEVFYGTTMPAETALESDIPARQAILHAGLPPETLSLTVDRACCSSMTAVQLAYRSIKAGDAEVCLAVGAENMSRVPLLLPQARWGSRLGHQRAVDPLFEMGYADWNPVAVDTGEVAVERGVGREEQDAWALRSQQRWAAADAAGKFRDELVPVEIPQKKGPALEVERDESPRPDITAEKLARLGTVYGSPTITPGNAPGLDTGASAILLMSRRRAAELGVPPLAEVTGVGSVALAPRLLAEAPAPAILKALGNAGLTLEQVDLIEINEAFAAVPLVATKALGKGDPAQVARLRERLNVNGGAVAIGHPVGASGARLVLTLMYELRRRGGGCGVAAICGGLAQGDACVLRV